MIIDLDDPASLDPAVAGAKAAWLAVGRRAGLPILPGVVVDAGVGRAAMALGTETLERRGTGAARLAIVGIDLAPELLAALPGAVAGLGPCLVVRSSSPLEGDGTWAGAFTSYLDVTAEEVPTAIRGCWASAFSNGTIERAALAGVDPGDLSLAVLIQPAIAPEAGGTARFVGEEIRVVAVRGSPAPLLQGWEPGVRGTVQPDGTVDGAVLTGLLGPGAVADVARTLHWARTATGASSCEWAIADGRLTILQLGREVDEAAATEATPLPVADAAGIARLERMARAIRHAPGALGEALVLPWALGEASRAGGDRSRGGPVGPADPDGPADHEPEPLDPGAALASAVALAADLTAAAWRLPGIGDDDVPARAATAVAGLRGPDPLAAAAILGDRPAVEPAASARLHRLLARVRSGLVAAGAAGTDADAWYLSVDQARAALAHPPTDVRAGRPRLDPWMPFQAAVILASGERRIGEASGPGIGVGRLTVVDDVRRPDRVGSRDVLVAPRPLPHLAPLLWDAAAVVTAGGGPGAHLFESARALGLPAVSGVGMDDFLAAILAGGPGSWAIAVDGTTGTVAITAW
jgi:hypothetical protein